MPAEGAGGRLELDHSGPARRFESCRTHVNTEREERAGESETFVEDGNTFLSREELDDYREQKMLLAWEGYAYV